MNPDVFFPSLLFAVLNIKIVKHNRGRGFKLAPATNLKYISCIAYLYIIMFSSGLNSKILQTD